MQAHHHVMKIRGDINAVSEGLDRGHALLAAFLEATGKIDRRVLQRRSALTGDAPMAVNLEALPTLLEAHPELLEENTTSVEASLTAPDAGPVLLEAAPTSVEAGAILSEATPTTTAPKSLAAPYTFRRANLVKP